MCMSMQAAFTAKELREITKLPGVQVHIPQEALQLTEADRAEMKASRIKKRVYDILKTACEAPASGQAFPLLDIKASRMKKSVYDILKTACEAPVSGRASPLLDTARCPPQHQPQSCPSAIEIGPSDMWG